MGSPLPLSLETAEVEGGYCTSDRPVKEVAGLSPSLGRVLWL